MLKNKRIRIAALCLHFIAVVMFFVVPIILGSTVGNPLWLGIGFLHTLLFALAFLRDYKKKRAITVIATILNIAIVLFSAVFFTIVSLLAISMVIPIPEYMLVFMLFSLVATILTCTSPRKYITDKQSPEEEAQKENTRFARVTKRPLSSILCVVLLLMTINVGIDIGSVVINPEQDVFASENFAEISGPSVYLSSSAVHGQIAVSYLEFMNYNVRDRFPFSYGERDAAVWIVEELLAIGYDMHAIEVQEFAMADAIIAATGGMLEGLSTMPLYFGFNSSPFMNLDLRRSELSQNIILTVPGARDEVMIVAAHYDAPLGAGTSDNASGVALLLESAKRMLEMDNEYTIIYIFLGAEEVGLLGVYYYLASLTDAELDNIKFAINADVLLEGDGLFVARGHYVGGVLSENAIIARWDDIAEDVNASENANLMPWLNGIFATSDNLAFLDYDITTMFLLGLCLNYIGDGWRDIERGIQGLLSPMDYNLNTVLHTIQDNFAFINESRPGMMENNMRIFSLYLEQVLLASY
jgi:hypothetical protein